MKRLGARPRWSGPCSLALVLSRPFLQHVDSKHLQQLQVQQQPEQVVGLVNSVTTMVETVYAGPPALTSSTGQDPS